MEHAYGSEDIGRKASANAVLDKVPTLDLGPWLAGQPGALDQLAAQLREVLERVGFFYLINHGVPQSLIDRTFAEGRRFHSLSLERKLEIKLNTSVNGYMPVKGSSDRHSKMNKNPAPNENESFFAHRERDPNDPAVKAGRDFRGPNQWPRDLPGFKETVLEYKAALESLGQKMIRVFARAVDLPEDYFAPYFYNGELSTRLLHYLPATREQIESGVFGHGAHTDRNFMTFVAQSDVEGLEILTTRSEWLGAPIVPGAFVVNAGDTLRRWSNDRFLSTPHRVQNKSGTDRYSIAFFYGPNLSSTIECIPTCHSPGNPPKHPPILYEDFKREFADLYFMNRNKLA